MKRVLIVSAILVVASLVSWAQTGTAPPVTTASKEALALYEKAVDLLENIEYDKARPLLDEAIQKDPAFAMAYLRRAQVGGDGPNAGRQNVAKAVALADKVSPPERQWIMIAQAQADAGFPEVTKRLDELLKLTPNDKHALLYAGNSYRGIGEEKKALELYERATAIDPAYAAAHNQIGYVNIALGNMAGAEAAFKKYIATRPDSPNPYDSYAELLLTLGRYDESIAQYNAALARDPKFSGSLAGLGHDYVFKGDYAKARESYTRLHDLGGLGNRLSGVMWTAVSYVHEGKTDDALKALDRNRDVAMKEGAVPAAINAHAQQVFVLVESNRAPDAQPHLAEAGRLIETAQFPDRVKAMWQRQIEMVAARAAAKTGDFAAAAAHLDKAKALTPADMPQVVWEAYESAACFVEFHRGNYDAALAHFKKTSPDDLYTMFYAAEAARLKGDAAGAAAMYKKVTASSQNSLFLALVRSRAMKAAAR